MLDSCQNFRLGATVTVMGSGSVDIKDVRHADQTMLAVISEILVRQGFSIPTY